MATSILSLGTGAATSADQVIAAGGVANLFLSIDAQAASGPQPAVQIQYKKADNTYAPVAMLTSVLPTLQLRGPLTWRAVRTAASTAQAGLDVEVEGGAGAPLATAAASTGAGTPVAGVPRMKTFQASGTTSAGAGSATVQIQGSNGASGPWDVIGTITLTLSTTIASDSFTSNDRYAYLRSNVTAISGTGASVNVTMGV
ncbi:hypothetical protein [uncultured Pseudacidovorax sp.]|uniref:hypothetical protein n=1 Tax=uncultured Pseudacidovorax sp. TaxID=679313 RepID=UPI0025D8AF0B|nr:hypothetical protein [uncultured Pseudacidovorax sp.]